MNNNLTLKQVQEIAANLDLDLVQMALSGTRFKMGQTSIVTKVATDPRDTAKPGFIFIGSDYYGKLAREDNKFGILDDRFGDQGMTRFIPINEVYLPDQFPLPGNVMLAGEAFGRDYYPAELAELQEAHEDNNKENDMNKSSVHIVCKDLIDANTPERFLTCDQAYLGCEHHEGVTKKEFYENASRHGGMWNCCAITKKGRPCNVQHSTKTHVMIKGGYMIDPSMVKEGNMVGWYHQEVPVCGVHIEMLKKGKKVDINTMLVKDQIHNIPQPEEKVITTVIKDAPKKGIKCGKGHIHNSVEEVRACYGKKAVTPKTIKCGNCKNYHATAAEVKNCYSQSRKK